MLRCSRTAKLLGFRDQVLMPRIAAAQNLNRTVRTCVLCVGLVGLAALVLGGCPQLVTDPPLEDEPTDGDVLRPGDSGLIDTGLDAGEGADVDLVVDSGLVDVGPPPDVGIVVRGGISSGGSASAGTIRLKNGGLERGSRVCASSMCVTGGIEP
jgi:hypothetical protein